MKDKIQYPESGIIYGLVDLKRKHYQVRYIGKTIFTVKKRLANHFKDANYGKKICHRIKWIKWMQKNNRIITTVILARVPIEELNNKEIEIIKSYRDRGYDLVNGTDGGDGMNGASEEVRRKIGKANGGTNNGMYGKKHTPETLALYSKTRLGRRGKKHNIHTRRKISEARKGQRIPDNVKEKVGKLNWESIEDIRNKYPTGKYSYKELGVLYSVTWQTIYRTVTNKIWIRND